jgi:hypothetical protein
VRLNCVPNTHVTALCYRKIRSFPESGGTVARVSCLFFFQLDLPSSHSPRSQTKKLRRIDCNNRYCVWSKAHPQPVNLCQPCYCDKVSYASLTSASISSRSAQTSLFANSTPLSRPRTDAILCCFFLFLFLPSFLLPLTSPNLISHTL